MAYLTVPLEGKHQKAAFTCGKLPLDQYLKTQAGQDVRRRVSTCFVFADKKENILGYYTLSTASISRDLVPEEAQKKLPRYGDVPVILLGRLALDISQHGTGKGKLLLIDALKRALEVTATVGSVAVIVDPIDSEAEAYYSKYGFLTLSGSDKMFLPMKTIENLFEK